DDVGIGRHQTCRVAPYEIHIVGEPALVELDIAAVRPSQLCQLLLECANTGFAVAITFGERHYDSDAPHAPALLRSRRERPRRRRAADESHELAALHSITSSAIASSLSGIWRLSAFAALRLITSSNFVGCNTGKSAGLVPLRILP